MSERSDELSQSLISVEDQISKAAIAAGRDRDDVTLIAVTKTYPVSDVQILRDLGVMDFGENRSDEGGVKANSVQGIWHFQGQIQSRKLRDIAAWASYIHSIDSTEHIGKLGRITEELEKKISVFLQLSLDGAPDRGGVVAQALPELALKVLESSSLDLVGLMCVPPVEYEHDRAFSEIAKVSQKFQDQFPAATSLSAGMSGDFEKAVSYGATHLRIGSQILGSRRYHP